LLNEISIVSYLHALHLVPRKKIFLAQTLHVDNFMRLLHLRITERERERKNHDWRIWLEHVTNTPNNIDNKKRILDVLKIRNGEEKKATNKRHTKKMINTDLCWILCVIRCVRIGDWVLYRILSKIGYIFV